MSTKKEAPAGLLKAGELARQAQISVTTVKYYVKEGLVQPACKTGPNMAYYAPECVERIRLIKTLQKERYYPLSVIRDLLDRQRNYSREVDLLDAIHKVDYRSRAEKYSAGEALKLSGLTRAQAAELARRGLIRPETEGRRLEYSESDVRVMQLARRRLDAGLPFGHTLRAFGAYEQALRAAVEDDINSFIRASFLADSPSTEDAIRMIQVSDESLDAFVALRRAVLNREYGSRQLELLDRYADSLSAAMSWLAGELDALGQAAAAARVRGAEEAPEEGGAGGAALYHYSLLLRTRGEEITRRAMACGKACAWFAENPAGGAAPEERFLAAVLRCCWLYLAPPVLECGAAAGAARPDMEAAAREYLGGRGAAFADRLLQFLAGERRDY